MIAVGRKRRRRASATSAFRGRETSGPWTRGGSRIEGGRMRVFAVPGRGSGGGASRPVPRPERSPRKPERRRSVVSGTDASWPGGPRLGIRISTPETIRAPIRPRGPARERPPRRTATARRARLTGTAGAATKAGCGLDRRRDPDAARDRPRAEDAVGSGRARTITLFARRRRRRSPAGGSEGRIRPVPPGRSGHGGPGARHEPGRGAGGPAHSARTEGLGSAAAGAGSAKSQASRASCGVGAAGRMVGAASHSRPFSIACQ